MMVAHKLNAAA